MRSSVHALARLLGNLNAVRKGTVARRAGAHLAGRAAGRLFRRLFR